MKYNIDMYYTFKYQPQNNEMNQKKFFPFDKRYNVVKNNTQ